MADDLRMALAEVLRKAQGERDADGAGRSRVSRVFCALLGTIRACLL